MMTAISTQADIRKRRVGDNPAKSSVMVFSGAAKAPMISLMRLFRLRWRPVSIEMIALMPARKPVVSTSGAKQNLSGTR